MKSLLIALVVTASVGMPTTIAEGGVAAKAPTCSVTQREYRTYVKKVYARPKVEAHAVRRMNDMHSCLKSPKAKANMSRLRGHLLHAYLVRIRYAHMGPKGIALRLMGGKINSQFKCLVILWTRESGWDPHSHNASSGAHGIPQALPGSKMASAGPDWYNNPLTQIRWGLRYIAGRYRTACAALAHSYSYNWY